MFKSMNLDKNISSRICHKKKEKKVYPDSRLKSFLFRFVRDMKSSFL